MRVATKAEEMQMLAMVARYEPVVQTSRCACGRQVAQPRGSCILCLNNPERAAATCPPKQIAASQRP